MAYLNILLALLVSVIGNIILLYFVTARKNKPVSRISVEDMSLCILYHRVS